MRDDFYVRKFGSTKAALLGSSELRKYLAYQIENRVKGRSDRRMIILSAHDTTITMLLSALNLEQDEAPPFASTLIFEVWSASMPYVKLMYNDVELDLHEFCFDLPGNDTLTCDFKTFKKRLVQGTHENTMLECKNTSVIIDDEDDGEAALIIEEGEGQVS